MGKECIRWLILMVFVWPSAKVDAKVDTIPEQTLLLTRIHKTDTVEKVVISNAYIRIVNRKGQLVRLRHWSVKDSCLVDQNGTVVKFSDIQSIKTRVHGVQLEEGIGGLLFCFVMPLFQFFSFAYTQNIHNAYLRRILITDSIGWLAAVTLSINMMHGTKYKTSRGWHFSVR